MSDSAEDLSLPSLFYPNKYFLNVSINSSTPFGGCRSVVILLRAKLHNLQPLRL
jgi:hypothetical protein